jgi:hypothetical protein
MSAQAGSSTSSLAQGRSGDEGMRAVYLHGVRTGLIGALAVAIWFLYLDFSRGRMLYTPTVLGTVLFEGREKLATLEALPPSIVMTLVFSLVHGVVFVLVGIACARLLATLEHRPNLFLSIALLFIVLGLGFLAFSMTFAALPLDVLSWPDVLFGNLLAAAAMVAHLLRRRPGRESQAA